MLEDDEPASPPLEAALLTCGNSTDTSVGGNTTGSDVDGWGCTARNWRSREISVCEGQGRGQQTSQDGTGALERHTVSSATCASRFLRAVSRSISLGVGKSMTRQTGSGAGEPGRRERGRRRCVVGGHET